MKLSQLSRTSGENEEWSTLNVRFPPELWAATEPYRERREAAGICRLGLRVVLAIIGELDIESAADHLVISCASDEDAQELAWQCERLGKLVREQAYKRMRE